MHIICLEAQASYMTDEDNVIATYCLLCNNKREGGLRPSCVKS